MELDDLRSRSKGFFGGEAWSRGLARAMIPHTFLSAHDKIHFSS